MAEERKKELCARLENYIEQQDRGWHAHALIRTAVT